MIPTAPSSISPRPADETPATASSHGVIQAVKNAATKAGVSFAYLLKKATVESGLNPNAQAKTSSATGLFQFTDQTWLRIVKSRGVEHGLGQYADQIGVDGNGKAYVNDAGLRRKILDLRKDPQISSQMACELDKANAQALQGATGGCVGPTELYLAHFLGASGASSFLSALRTNPNAKASDILPKAAGANSSIFYEADGRSRSVGEIYRSFARKFGDASAIPTMGAAAPVELASASLAASSDPSQVSSSDAVSGTGAVSASGSVPGHLNSDRAALMASLVREQMHLASLAASIADDDAKEQKTFSLLA